MRAVTAGDRERHLRRKWWDNRKNDNQVGGEWVQQRKRWSGLIEERAQKLRDVSDARNDGRRKRGWRTRTGRWREGRDGRAAVSWQIRRGREIERGGAGKGGGWKCRGGGHRRITSPSLWVIISSLLLYHQSALHSAFSRCFQQQALMLCFKNHETKMSHTLQIYQKVRMCRYVVSSIIMLIHFICKFFGSYFVDYIISADGRDLHPRLGDGIKGRKGSFWFCVHIRG